MQVILISGKAQHGKDTTAGFMKQILEGDGYSVLVTHYGDLLKYICKTFFGWNGEKDEAGRTLLQQVGTNTIRAKCPDYWVDFVAGVLKMFPNKWDYVLISDCRFPNEVDGMANSGLGTIHVRVVRENFESSLTAEQQKHLSETALDHVIPDYYIRNSGSLEDLGMAVAEFLSISMPTERERISHSLPRQITFWKECGHETSENPV